MKRIAGHPYKLGKIFHPAVCFIRSLGFCGVFSEVKLRRFLSKQPGGDYNSPKSFWEHPASSKKARTDDPTRRSSCWLA